MARVVPIDTVHNIKKRQQLSFRRWIVNRSGGRAIAPYIGDDIDACRQYISNQFIAGMTWNNYGDWVLDHIVPLRLFDLRDEDELKICWSYWNLMPMWKADNLHKEGNLHFSGLVLKRLPVNAITITLINRASAEEHVLHKYLN